MRGYAFVFLASLLWLAVAVGGDARPGDEKASDFPFEYIPKVFQGDWVLARYRAIDDAQPAPADPEKLIGKRVSISKTKVTVFGHLCRNPMIFLDGPHDVTRPFDRDVLKSPGAASSYASRFDLEVYCHRPLASLLTRIEAAFLSRNLDVSLYFRVYGPGAPVVTMRTEHGPEFILRPADAAPPGVGKAPAFPLRLIPEIFHGAWVLTKYDYSSVLVDDNIDPDDYLGKKVVLGDASMNVFGHQCVTRGVIIDLHRPSLRYGDLFNTAKLQDPDIQSFYPAYLTLSIMCFRTEPDLSPGALAFMGGLGVTNFTFRSYDPAARFITMIPPYGPEFILRPLER